MSGSSSSEDIKKKGLFVYLLITFGLSWSIILGSGLAKISPDEPIAFITGIPAAFSPALAALIVRKWGPHDEVSDVRLRVNAQKWQFYLVAWLFPLAVVVFNLVISQGLRIGEPDFTLQRYFTTDLPTSSFPDEMIPKSFSMVVLQAPIFAILLSPMLLGEEFGWRGYLQVRLFEDRPLYAAIATGVIWGLWHFPQILMGYSFPETPILGLLLLTITTVLLSIIFGWLQLKTDSIWAPSLAHAAYNSISGLILMLLFIGDPNYWIFTAHYGILSWLPLGVMCTWIVVTNQLDPTKIEERKKTNPDYSR